MAEAFDDTVATKADIFAVKAGKAALKQDIAAVKAALKQEIAGLKSDFKIFKFLFAPAVILLLLKIAFFS